MSDPTNLDRVRTAALDRIEKAERNYKLGILLVVGVELLFGGLFLFLMDFRDRLHWLILLAACLTYGMLLVAVVNLGKYINASTQAILRAIFTRDPEADDRGR